MGPAETARRLGIANGTLKTWASRAGVHWDPEPAPVDPETGAETGPPPDAARVRARVEAIQARVEESKALHEARQAELRQALRTKLLERAHDALDRWDLPHVDFKGKDADQVTYPSATDQGVQALAQAAATLMKEYRLEVGEATSRPEVGMTVKDAIRGDHERDALRAAIERELADRGEPVR